MGYEVKIYAGHLGSSAKPGEPRYMQVIGMVDLCKVSQLRPSEKGELVYFYYEQQNGDTATTEDRYGDKLRAIPVKQMLAEVEKASKGSDYRRWKPAIALLESLIDFPEDDVYCVVYGY